VQTTSGVFKDGEEHAREKSACSESPSCRKSNLSAHGEREEESKSQTSFVDCGDVRVVVSTLLTSVPCGT